MSAPVVKLSIDGVDYACQPILCTTLPPSGLYLLPAGVTPTIAKLDALAWIGVHDDATSGTAAGVTAYPVAIGGRQARSFPNRFTQNGGMRYHTVYAHDAEAKHFIFAGDLWIDSDPHQIGQMELDNNQVLTDGRTVIFGVQCDANTGTWMITVQDPKCRWIATQAKGNPQQWPTKTWIHFEHLCHRDDAGNVTYESIYFNGATMPINQTFASAQDLNWGQDCLVNVQIGGKGSGSVLVYGSNLQTVRW